MAIAVACPAQAQSAWYVNNAQTVNDVFTTAAGNDANTGASPSSPKLTINAAIAAAAPGDTLFIDAGVYMENVVVNKTLYIKGAGQDLTQLDGTGTQVASGISLSPNVTNVSIEGLSIFNFTGVNPNTSAGIYAVQNNNNLTIRKVTVHNNTSCSGIFVRGPVEHVLIDSVSVYNHGSASGVARGIVVWSGFKKNITVQNSTVSNNTCCGIELSDGTASGVIIRNNTISGVDNSIGLMGLRAGAGPNIISDNTITANGRFGIEIKNPNGTGNDDETEDGAIIVKNNQVTFGSTADARDLAGIAVFRRGYIDGLGYPDVPTGVVVKGNTVTGFQQNAPGSVSNGFGIVVEGTNHKVITNTVSGNDVNIQRQAGHLPYTPWTNIDGAQEDGRNDGFFGRGNAPYSCSIEITGNTPSNTVTDVNYLPNSNKLVINRNNGETFCSIGSAIADVRTLNGDSIRVTGGGDVYDELVDVSKSLHLQGTGQAVVTYTGTVPAGTTPSLFKVTAQNVTIDSFLLNADFSKLWSAILTSGNTPNLTVSNNVITAMRTSNANAAAYTDRNAISINSIRSIPGVTVSASGFNGTVIRGNIIQGSPAGPGLDAAYWRAGVHSERCGIVVGGDQPADGNTITSINHDVLIRFQTSGGAIVRNNTFLGGGLQYAEPNAGGGDVTIEHNVFDYSFPIAPYFSLLRLQNNTAGKNVLVKNNSFNGHNWYISMENFRNATIDSNVFTPVIKDAANNNQYRHITINTKLLASTGLASIQRQAVGATVINNRFNGLSSGTAAGKALAFYNHWNDGGAAYGTFRIGRELQPNSFSSSINTYLYLDSSNNEQTSNMTAAYPEFTEANAVSSTTGYWTADIDASNNIFDIGNGDELAADMSYAEVPALDPQVFDRKDVQQVGRVLFRMPVLNVTTQTRYPTIQEAVDAASPGDSLFAEARGWEYHEDVTLNKQGLTLYGTLNSLDTTRLIGLNRAGAGPNTLSIGSGATASHLMITREGNNLTDWNTNVKNQGVSMASGATLRNCLVTGNRNGVYINNARKALVEYCDIHFNRTGIQLANNTDSTIVRNNNITDNWTVGVLYNFNNQPDFTGNVMINRNNITGNWYSQAENRSATVIDMAGNWWGSSSISLTSNPSGEPGYNVQVPAAYGGAAQFSDGNNYMISGAGATIDYTGWLPQAANTAAAGAPGFEPVADSVYVNLASPVAAGKTKLERAAYVVNDPGTLVLLDAAIPSVLIAGKDLLLKGAGSPASLDIDGIVFNGPGKTLSATAPVHVSDSFNLIAGRILSDTVNRLVIDGTNTRIHVTPAVQTFVDGPLYVNNVATDMIFPVGKNSRGNYIMLNHAAGSGNMVAEYFPQAQAISPEIDEDSLESVSDKEYWMLNRTSGDVSGRVGLYMLDAAFSHNGTLSDAGSQSIVVAKYDADSLKWISLGNDNQSDLSDNPLVISAGTVSGSFSPFTFGIPFNTPLPLSIIDFNGREEGETAVLGWTTVNESNTDHYELEKSTDGKNFSVIAEVRALHNATRTYSFTDNRFGQSSYYRLKEVNIGGSGSYTHIVFLQKDKGRLQAGLYPNPARDYLYINVPGNSGLYDVQVYDGLGKLVLYRQQVAGKAGIALSGLAAGSYRVQISGSDGARYSLAFVKK